MRLSYLVGRAAYFISILAASSLMLIETGQAQSTRSYRGTCSFYGQDQPEAHSIGCSIEQSSWKIVIRWDDGYETTLEYDSTSDQWLSMPSRSESTVNFYAETGDVAKVEIHAGPGQGLISIRR